jgi:hypothetical protein
MALSMLSSATDKNRLAPMRDGIDKRTNGYKRRHESMRKSTYVLVDMVSLAMTAGTTAQHLLLDSCFAFPATIRRIKALGMHTVCMLKDTGKVIYEMQGWPLSLKDLQNLAKEFQSRSFDALVAHATLVCCRYIMLELAKRENVVPRTLGSLFHAVCDEMRQIVYTEALALLLKLLEETLGNVIGLCKKQVKQLIERFIETYYQLLSGNDCYFWLRNVPKLSSYQAVTDESTSAKVE